MPVRDSPAARIAERIRRRITDGELRPGDRVPSTRALVREHGVASATAARALGLLGDEGWVRAVPNVGTVVADRRPPRTRSTAVEVAIDLADGEGLAAVSLRRVAAELSTPTMTLHGQVRGRDGLVLAMIEAAFSEFPLPASRPAGWRAALEVSARVQWAAYRRHPWLASVVSLTRPQPLAVLLRIGEWDLTALEEVATEPTARFDLHLVLCSYVRGMAIGLVAEAEARADTGLDAGAWADRDPALARALAEHGGPALARVHDYDLDLDRVFDAGLARLLDGFAS